MRDSASSRIQSVDAAALFQWDDFDGDDCCSSFYLEIASGGETERFDFGECVVWGLRRVVRFLRGEVDKASEGFRCPDNRIYDLDRNEEGISLQLCFEGTNQSRRFQLSRPTLTFEVDFLKAYDAKES